MKVSGVIFLAATVLFSNIVWAEQVSKKEICAAIVPSILEMVTRFSGVPAAFKNAYDNQFDADAKLVFAPVLQSGLEAERAMEAYRKAYLDACYD